MADEDENSAPEASSSDSDSADEMEDMGVRLVARSADGTKLVNALDVFPRFELSI